ncbi:unnamed protein product [Heterobilharzia americana]|nr:unnamed protein product [Heterobilharzia americana]
MYHLLPYLRYEDGRPRTTRNPKNGEPNLEKGINEGLEAESQKTTSTWCDPSDYSNQGIKCLSYTNAYGSCNFANLTSALKPRYTHFDAPLSNVGGAEYLADHCPFFKTFDSVDHLHKNSHCGDTNNRRYEENNGIKYKQHYGKKSRCINYGIHYYSGVPKEIPVAGCYRVRCTLRFELKIFFKGVWYTCPKSGGRIVTMKDNTSEDWIECPSYRDICSQEEDSDILKLQRNQSLQTVDSNRSIPSSDS